jgi:hypothetical protein
MFVSLLRPRAGRASVASLFVRRTQTRSRSSGEPYFTYRMVRTERVGGRVKQITLLHLAGPPFRLATRVLATVLQPLERPLVGAG